VSLNPCAAISPCAAFLHQAKSALEIVARMHGDIAALHYLHHRGVRPTVAQGADHWFPRQNAENAAAGAPPIL